MMKEYLLLFWNVSGGGKYTVSPEEMEQNMTLWQSWIGHIAMQGKLVATKPIKWEGVTVSNTGTEPQPAIREDVMVTGYMICKSENADEVKEWAKTCPILQHPAGFVEIRESAPFE